MTELKPCPFCGGDAALNCIGDTENGAEWWVEHYCCGNSVGIQTDFMKSPDEAIEAWNTRFTLKYSEDTLDFAYGNDAVYWHDEYEKLAKAVEIIRDATERTCKTVEKNGVLHCSECDYPLGVMSVDAFCGGCGAKVVER